MSIVQSQSIFRSMTGDVEIITDTGDQNKVYELCLSVRGSTQNRFDFDSYSHHYCLLLDGRPVGSLTATRAVDGAVDCQYQYPADLIKRYRDRLVSSCKFRINRTHRTSFGLLRLMGREVWRDFLKQGIRLDVINARLSMAPSYVRSGYIVLPDSHFVHPVLGTESVVLVLPADPQHRSWFQDIFSSVTDVLPVKQFRELSHGGSPVS